MYVMAGFFILDISVLAFSNVPTETMKIKFIGMSIFGVFAAVLIIIAAAFNGFKKWKTGVGAVLISGTSVTMFVVLTEVFIRLDPNGYKFVDQLMKQQQMIERNKYPTHAFKSFPGNPFEMFSDYTTGFGTLLILLILGIFLVISEKRKLDNKEAACE